MSDEEAADARSAASLLLRAVTLLEKAKCVRARNHAVHAYHETQAALGAFGLPGPPRAATPARFRRFPVRPASSHD